MSEEKPYVGDIGTLIEVETGVDLSVVATLEIRVVKPNGTTDEWTATKSSSNDSIAQYTIIADDFNVAGTWTGQIYVSFDADNTWFGRTFSFELFALGA